MITLTETEKETQKSKCKTLLSVIMPVYNESMHLKKILDKVLAAPLLEDLDKEIIIIDDGSIDETSEILKEYHDNKIVRVHQSILNFGKGTAIRIGLKICKGDIVLIQDGDLEYNPENYIDLVKPIVNDKALVVYGSRFLGSIKGMKFLNFLGNKFLSILISLLYGYKITDEATAYKAFRADLIKSLDLRCQGFEFCPEVTSKLLKRGIKIKEVPIEYSGRSFTEGKKVSWKDFFVALYTILKLRF